MVRSLEEINQGFQHKITNQLNEKEAQNIFDDQLERKEDYKGIEQNISLKEPEYRLPFLKKILKIVSKAANAILYGAIFISMLSIIIYTGNLKGKFFGFSYVNILSTEIEHEFPKGTLLILRETSSENIHVMDIVTLSEADSKKDMYRVTAVINKENAHIFTIENIKPDNSTIENVTEDRIKGVVKMRLPYIGFTIDYISGHIFKIIIFFSAVAALSIGMMFFYASFCDKERKRVRKRVLLEEILK